MPLPMPGMASTFLGSSNDVGDLLRQGFDGFGGVAIRADAERVLAVDFQQVGGFEENARDGFVVHGGLKSKTISAEERKAIAPAAAH